MNICLDLMLNFNLSCGGKLEELINVSKTTSIVLFLMLGFGNLAQLLRNIVDIINANNRGRYFFILNLRIIIGFFINNINKTKAMSLSQI